MLQTAIASLQKRWFVFALGVLVISSIAMAAFFALVVLQNFPNSADEYAYIFQAENLAKGRVFSPLHPVGANGENLQRYFYFVHIGETDGKYYGRFPPGYSLLLAAALAAGEAVGFELTWLVNPLLGGAAVAFIALIGCLAWGPATGLVAGLIAGANSWFLFNSGSYFSHAATAACVAAAIFFFLVALRSERGGGYLVLSGFLTGFAVLIRLLDPFPVVAGLSLYYLICCRSRAHRMLTQDLTAFVAGGLPCLLFFLIYNYAITGHAFLTPYQYYNPHDQSTRFIFVDLENGGEIDFSRVAAIGWPITRDSLQMLSRWFPAVGLLWLLPVTLISGYLRRREEDFGLMITLLLIPVLLIVVYTLYGGPPVNQYGPRYFYVALIPLSLLAARSIAVFFPGSLRPLVLIPAGVLVLSTAPNIYRTAQDYSLTVYKRRDLFRRVERAGLDHAVVFLETGSDTMPTCDLTRNGTDFDRPVIFAQNHEGDHEDLKRYYRGRDFYLYRYDRTEGKGVLTALPR